MNRLKLGRKNMHKFKLGRKNTSWKKNETVAKNHTKLQCR